MLSQWARVHWSAARPTYVHQRRILCMPKSRLLLPYVWIMSLLRFAHTSHDSAIGSDCKGSLNNNPSCETSNSPPPPPDSPPPPPDSPPPPPPDSPPPPPPDSPPPPPETTTTTYEDLTTSTSAYGYSSAYTYTSLSRTSSTTPYSTKSSSRDSDNFSVANANTTTTSALSGNAPPVLSSAKKSTSAYTGTSIMFLLVAAGLV